MKEDFDLANTDQIVMRVGKACNFKCNFCNVAENEQNIQFRESAKEIARNFHYRLKYTNTSSKIIHVSISGGEPSIFQKEVIFILTYSKKILSQLGIEPKFDIQTNGSNIDKEFAFKLKKLGVISSLVSFHATDKKIFEDMIGVNYKEYQKVIIGIINLHEAGIKVYTNTIISQQNKDNFLDTIYFLVKNLPFVGFNLGVIQPHGEASKNLIQKYVKYEDIEDCYNRAIYYLRSQGKYTLSHLVGPPACYMNNFKVSLEIARNIRIRKSKKNIRKNLISSINDSNKIQTKECSFCLYNSVCSGIWKSYVGLQKVRPFFFIKDFYNEFQVNQFAEKVKTTNQDIKKIYTKNIRQILIPSNIGDVKETEQLIYRALHMGFYKISFLIFQEIDFSISKILTSGVSNIQILLEYISYEDVVYLIESSDQLSPQFRIDLDVFITDFSEENVSKLKELFTLLPNDYLKFYFIYPKNSREEFLRYRHFLKDYSYSGYIFSINCMPHISYRKQNA